jgi:hypothetical protein
MKSRQQTTTLADALGLNISFDSQPTLHLQQQTNFNNFKVILNKYKNQSD